MGEDARDPVIRLDERGVELLRSLADPCSEFRVTVQHDGSIVLHPMSAHDADLWRSGLVEEIAGKLLAPGLDDQAEAGQTLTARLLDFAPAAWQAYQGLPAGELGSRVKRALQRLAADPAAVRADPWSRRYEIIEERLPQALQVWGLPVDTPGGSRWLVVWREMPHAIEIGYIGPVPGHAGEGARRA